MHSSVLESEAHLVYDLLEDVIGIGTHEVQVVELCSRRTLPRSCQASPLSLAVWFGLPQEHA
jgi:hypothetical protein